MKASALIKVLVFLGVSVSVAAAVDDYEQRLAVDDRSQNTRLLAIDASFEAMVRAITGSTADELAPNIQAIVDRASDFVDNYAYATGEDGQIYIDVLFSESLVDTALLESGAAIMPLAKPEVLILFASSEAGLLDKQVMTDFSSEASKEILSDFKRFGFDARFPDWNLQDNLLMTSEDVWGQNIEQAHILAERYGADCLVLGSGYKASTGRWRGSWQTDCYSSNQRTPIITASEAQFFRYPRNLVVADVLQRDGIDLSLKAQSFVLRVDLIDRYESYIELVEYLKSLQQVGSVEVASLDGVQVTFRITIIDSPNKFLTRLEHDNQLVFIDEGRFAWRAAMIEGVPDA